ncbi:MAG: hypothetical protein M0001_00590 [Treponema sp.]|nr:hypothetical protein [Treponema sp.]
MLEGLARCAALLDYLDYLEGQGDPWRLDEMALLVVLARPDELGAADLEGPPPLLVTLLRGGRGYLFAHSSLLCPCPNGFFIVSRWRGSCSRPGWWLRGLDRLGLPLAPGTFRFEK